MGSIPKGLWVVFQDWSNGFSKPVWPRFVTLLMAAILARGRRTVNQLLRLSGEMANGHWATYHKVLCRRKWSSFWLARCLIAQILSQFIEGNRVRLVVDDTVTEHRGRRVFGKGCHRDPIRSSHKYTAHRFGHKWVVLSIVVTLPGMNRPWALPVLCALYRNPGEDKALAKRHKTPVDLVRQLLCVIRRWFPEYTFVMTGDGAYGTHSLARFAHRHEDSVKLVSRFYRKANFYEPPPRRKPGTNGRPRKKGRKLPSPQDIVEATQKRQRIEVSWYGGTRRQVSFVTGTGHWYKHGLGLVPVRWVFVEDRTGTHRDEYFFTTDLEMGAKEIIECYTSRWTIEVTFEEAKSHLGLGSTRGWCQQTIERAEPCLFGLFSLVALWFSHLPPSQRETPVVQWQGKQHLTFSDAITCVRQDLWRNWVFKHPRHYAAFEKLNPRERTLVITALTQAL